MGPTLTAATSLGTTAAGGNATSGAGGMTANTSDVTTSGAGGTTSAGGMTASAGGSLGEGGGAAGEIEIEPHALVPGRYKLEYGASFSASGGRGSYEFRVTSGELPPGLELANDGTLIGTPAFPGSWSFTIEATDELGAHAEQDYTLEVQRNSLVVITVFLSSSSTRSDALLIDLTEPEDGVLHRQNYSRFPKFSPDGRWLKWETFDDLGTTDSYAQPLVDRTSLEQVPLIEDGTDDVSCAWSPDAKRLLCSLASSDDAGFDLGVRSVTDTSIGSVIPIADGVSDDARWLSPTRLVYTDADSGLFAADVNSTDVTVEPYLQALRDEVGEIRLSTAYGSERGVVAATESSPERMFVVELVTEISHELSAATAWMFAPQLHMMLGWNGTLDFLHATDGTELLGPLDTSSAGSLAAEASGKIALAPNRPRIVAVSNVRAIVSTLVDGALESVRVPGSYRDPQRFVFSPDGRWLTLATDTELWLTDVGAERPERAVKLGDVPQAAVVFAPDSSALAFVSGGRSTPNGGPPVTLAVVDLTRPPEFETRLLDTEDEWGWPTWSNDASYLFFLGASVAEGRALHVYDLLEPDSPQRFIVSCDVPLGSSPGCPNGVEFQPWVSWTSRTQPLP